MYAVIHSLHSKVTQFRNVSFPRNMAEDNFFENIYLWKFHVIITDSRDPISRKFLAVDAVVA